MARHALWQTRLADRTNSAIRIGRIGVWQSSANALIFGVENVLAIYLAVSLVLSGGFSVGMVSPTWPTRRSSWSAARRSWSS
jgi:ATP-binding cassette subfamily B protein RaxB